MVSTTAKVMDATCFVTLSSPWRYIWKLFTRCAHSLQRRVNPHVTQIVKRSVPQSPLRSACQPVSWVWGGNCCHFGADPEAVFWLSGSQAMLLRSGQTVKKKKNHQKLLKLQNGYFVCERRCQHPEGSGGKKNARDFIQHVSPSNARCDCVFCSSLFSAEHVC